jgi:hypothetical protein
VRPRSRLHRVRSRLDQDRSVDQRLARPVAPQFGRLRQAELPCEIPSEAVVNQPCVGVSHGLPPGVAYRVRLEQRDDALAAGGADGDEAQSGTPAGIALFVQHFRQRGHDPPARGSERVAGGQG